MLLGLRIALSIETSNAKPHADMYIRTLYYISYHNQNSKGVRKHTHETFTVALFLIDIEVAKFRSIKTKRPSKRLFHYVIAHPRTLSARAMRQRYNKPSGEQNKSVIFYPADANERRLRRLLIHQHKGVRRSRLRVSSDCVVLKVVIIYDNCL